MNVLCYLGFTTDQLDHVYANIASSHTGKLFNTANTVINKLLKLQHEKDAGLVLHRI